MEILFLTFGEVDLPWVQIENIILALELIIVFFFELIHPAFS